MDADDPNPDHDLILTTEAELASIEPSRFADGEPMLLAGVRRHHTFAEASQGISRQRYDFQRLPRPVPGHRGVNTYGVMCGSAPERGTFEYMCAVEVDTFEGLPDYFDRLRVPAQRYAVFPVDGGLGALEPTWNAILDDWLPRSGFVSAETPDFEVYGERINPRTGDGEIEIRVGVREAAPER